MLDALEDRVELMKSLIMHWFINGVALWVAVQVVPGIQTSGNIATLLIVVTLFCLVSGVVRPVFWLLTSPLILLTLGLFALVIEALILWLTAWLAGSLGLGFTVEGFMPALMGAIVVGIIRVIPTPFAQSRREKRTIREQQAWIGKLEKGNTWLEDQSANWRRLAEERERMIQEQEAWIEELQRARVWLKEQRDNCQRVAEEYQNHLKETQA